METNQTNYEVNSKPQRGNLAVGQDSLSSKTNQPPMCMPNQPQQLIHFTKLGICIPTLIFLLATTSCLGKNSNYPSDTFSDSIPDTISYVSKYVETTHGKVWQEHSEQDEMTDAMSYWATITSDNMEEFNFPYDGGSYLKITIRKSPKFGTDVYITISQGQFVCSSYKGTNHIMVRFDDAKAKKYVTLEPADGSSDCLFLSGAKDFISRAKKAKTIKIEAPFYQEGNRVFTFDLDEPLKWDH